MHDRLCYKTIELKTAQLAPEGTFTGYASVFGEVDTQGDIVERGAFKRAIAQGAHKIKLLWQHAVDEPIGMIEVMKEDHRGLYIRGRLLMDIARGREAYSLLKRDIVNGLSIGYRPKTVHVNPDSAIRHIRDLELFEISLVTFPANISAQVTIVKSAAQDAEQAALLRALHRGQQILTLLQ